MTIVTTIKQKFLAQIEAGVKTIDFRAYNKFWRKKFEGKQYNAICFLSGKAVKYYIVKRIEIIITPYRLLKTGIIKTELCYAIFLGERIK